MKFIGYFPTDHNGCGIKIHINEFIKESSYIIVVNQNEMNILKDTKKSTVDTLHSEDSPDLDNYTKDMQ